MGKLTAKSVSALTAPGRYSDDDGTGFHLRIDAEGRKYYVLRTQVGGKRRDIAIGSAKRITLSQAREKARGRLEQIERDGQVGGDIPTFSAAAAAAHSARTAGLRSAKHRDQWLQTLATYAFPTIGEKKVDEVERADVVKVLEPIWLAKPETASRVLQRIDRVMRWAVGHDFRRDRIDMTLVRDALPPRKRKRSDIQRRAAVSWPDAPEFWRSISTSPSRPEVRLGLSFLILTASRPGNIVLAKRSQFDLGASTWHIPAEEMKANEPHRVALSGAAVEMIRSIMGMHDAELLFAIGGQPMSPDTMRMMMRRMGRHETPHGFRSTFKDWSRAHGWADHLSEAALAHLDPNEVRAAYARADLLEERRPMMEAWVAYLTGNSCMPADHPQR